MLCNAFGVKESWDDRQPRLRCASLGFVVQRLRRKVQALARLSDPPDYPEEPENLSRSHKV
jgi:hypothetical protein